MIRKRLSEFDQITSTGGQWYARTLFERTEEEMPTSRGSEWVRMIYVPFVKEFIHTNSFGTKEVYNRDYYLKHSLEKDLRKLTNNGKYISG